MTGIVRSDLNARLIAMMGELTLDKAKSMGVRNAANNLPRIRAERSIVDLAGALPMRSEKALVIAAGPSLHKSDSAAMIKSSGYDGIIVATESSMVWCLRNGITPDLVVTVDPHPERIVRWFGDPELDQERLRGDDYFSRQDLEPYFAEDALRRNVELIDMINQHGPSVCLAISSSASSAVVQRAEQAGIQRFWWNPFYDDYDVDGSLTRQLHQENGLPCINAGGNVGTACWVIAHAVLGRTRIGLLGMDFGYYGDTPYNQTQYYRDLVELLGEERLAEVYETIINPYTNQDFYSDPAYLWYRDVFLEMAVFANEDGIETYNCTGGGILWGPGVEFCDFEDFVKA